MPYQLIQDIVLRVNNLVSNNFILSQSITPSPQSSFGSLLALKQSSFIFSVHSFLSFHCPTPWIRSTSTASTSPLIHSLKLQSLQASQSSSHLLIKPTGGLISQTYHLQSSMWRPFPLWFYCTKLGSLPISAILITFYSQGPLFVGTPRAKFSGIFGVLLHNFQFTIKYFESQKIPILWLSNSILENLP